MHKFEIARICCEFRNYVLLLIKASLFHRMQFSVLNISSKGSVIYYTSEKKDCINPRNLFSNGEIRISRLHIVYCW